jgi:hypothetical protein
MMARSREVRLLERAQSLFILQPSTIASKSDRNRIEQILTAEWLGQELDGTALHRLHRHRDVGVAGNENNRQVDIRCCKFALKIEAAMRGFLTRISILLRNRRR